MIFVTVGTQFPFDRLVGAVDAWAARSGREDVITQIGEGATVPQFVRSSGLVDAGACHDLIRNADLVVCHAGMGTVLTCLTNGTPVIVMPRLAALGEHRNDHQLDTVRWMHDLPGVKIVETASELEAALDAGGQKIPGSISAHADPELTATIRNFVEQTSLERRHNVRFRFGTFVGRIFGWMLPLGQTMNPQAISDADCESECDRQGSKLTAIELVSSWREAG